MKNIEITIECAVILLTECDRSIDIQQCLSRTTEDPALEQARNAAVLLEKAIRKHNRDAVKGFTL